MKKPSLKSLLEELKKEVSQLQTKLEEREKKLADANSRISLLETQRKGFEQSEREAEEFARLMIDSSILSAAKSTEALVAFEANPQDPKTVELAKSALRDIRKAVKGLLENEKTMTVMRRIYSSPSWLSMVSLAVGGIMAYTAYAAYSYSMGLWSMAKKTGAVAPGDAVTAAAAAVK